VIEGSAGKARGNVRKAGNSMSAFPVADRAFKEWERDGNRYVKWARICTMNTQQTPLMNRFDVTVRATVCGFCAAVISGSASPPGVVR
jgi:hypothetical protein